MADDNFSDVRIKQNLRVQIAEAKISSFNNNPRDTYCKICLDQEQVYTTKVVEKSNFPYYEGDYSCVIPRIFRYILLQICERNRTERDKVVGEIQISKEDLYDHHGHDQWFQLHPPKKEIKGQIQIEIKFTESIGVQGSPKPRKKGISVKLIECQELTLTNNSCNPVAYVYLWRGEGHKNEKVQSKVKKKTNSPKFGEYFFFPLEKTASNLSHSCNGESDQNLSVKVELYHKELFKKKSTFLGQVIIPIRELNSSQQHTNWYFLQGQYSDHVASGCRQSLQDPDAVVGSLRVKIMYNSDHVFSTHHYDKLRELILKSPNTQPISASAAFLLSQVVDNREEVAAPLVQLFHAHNQLIPFIKELAKYEMSSTTEITTLFRGDTLVCKVMQEMMKLFGLSYLHEVIQPIVDKVVKYRKTCEINPDKIQASESLDINRENLLGYVEDTVETIVSSGDKCPIKLCESFAALREAVLEHFPDNGLLLRHQVVSGFVFLRFFVLAFSNPAWFKLGHVTTDMTKRTLTLISKSIQTLSNLVSTESSVYEHKEEYMIPICEKLKTNEYLIRTKQFLDVISTVGRANQSNYDNPVVLKEGDLTMCTQGKENCFSRPKFKPYYFKLTNCSLTYIKKKHKDKDSNSFETLPINSIIAVEKLEEKSFTKPHMFQVIRASNPVVYLQADNCVTAEQWIGILNRVCTYNKNKLEMFHPSAFSKGQWLCCRNHEQDTLGCMPVTGISRDIQIDTDSDHNTERILSFFSRNLEKMDRLLDELSTDTPSPSGNGMVSNQYRADSNSRLSSIRIDNSTVCYNTLKNIVHCVRDLISHHDKYVAHMRDTAVLGSQEFPIGAEIVLPRVPSSQALAIRV